MNQISNGICPKKKKKKIPLAISVLYARAFNDHSARAGSSLYCQSSWGGRVRGLRENIRSLHKGCWQGNHLWLYGSACEKLTLHRAIRQRVADQLGCSGGIHQLGLEHETHGFTRLIQFRVAQFQLDIGGATDRYPGAPVVMAGISGIIMVAR